MNKTTIIVSLFSLICINNYLFCQDICTVEELCQKCQLKYDYSNPLNKDFVLFGIVQNMPIYEGGNEQIQKELNESLNNLVNEADSGIIIVQFIVDTTGNTGYARVLKSDLEHLNYSIIHFFNNMQGWMPGATWKEKVHVSKAASLKIKDGKINYLSE